MKKFGVGGIVLGKESSSSNASSMRAIMPLPALLQIIDVLLPASLDDFLNKILPCPEGCYLGARKGIKCLDIVH